MGTNVKSVARPMGKTDVREISGMKGRRTRWLDSNVNAKEKQAVYQPGEWNTFRIVAQGNRIRSFINGTPVADITDDRDAEGIIGFKFIRSKRPRGRSKSLGRMFVSVSSRKVIRRIEF